MTTKITSANIDATVASAADIAPVDSNTFNISLLGFKMAVNEGLTVFNLVDGVVDEFNDESGTDEAEGSNDTYCATNDLYQNFTLTPACVSAGFSVSSITEPDTSTTATNPAQGIGTYGSFTVPSGMTSVSVKVWGAGGSGGFGDPGTPVGGSGGFSTGTLTVSPGQTLQISAGEGGGGQANPSAGPAGPTAQKGGFGGYGPEPSPSPLGEINTGGGMGSYARGGGLSGVFSPSINFSAAVPTGDIPNVYMVAGSGGGGGGHGATGPGGFGGGTTGTDGTGTYGGEGGTQTQGGAPSPSPTGTGQGGGFLFGGDGGTGAANGGGAGFYGGAGGGTGGCHSGGGGGSAYIASPLVACGSTEQAEPGSGGGDTDPYYPSIPQTLGASCSPTYYQANINTGGGHTGGSGGGKAGGDGYILLTGSYCAQSPGGSSTIVSGTFTSSSVATNARIVVFEEDVETPTLNTDVIASVSRDGTNFTNVTLSDSGYVTGSSGQRILTGQADISGQPSGQSMRWKLALANNTVKIHGVSLQWS